MCCGVTYKRPANRSPVVGNRRTVTNPGRTTSRTPSQEPAETPVVDSPAKPIPRKKGFRLN